MQSAAGGTSQRLKPAVAIVRSLSRMPLPPPTSGPVLLIVVMNCFPTIRPSEACLLSILCPPLLLRVQRRSEPRRIHNAPGSLCASRVVNTPYPGLCLILGGRFEEKMCLREVGAALRAAAQSPHVCEGKHLAHKAKHESIGKK